MKRCNNCFFEYEDSYDLCPSCGYYDGQPAKELYHLFPGTILADRYLIGQVLGFGGFGITYKAWDTKLETVVAMKEYYPSGLVNRVPGEKEVILFAGNCEKEFRFGLKRFLNEAQNMAKFNSHKHIVNVFEYFEENNTAYIVMEFLDGVSLGGFMKMNSVDQESCIEVIQCICSALKEIHSHGIIHRDVSPDNIFLCRNGNVKLIDFGAARFSSNEEKQMTIILKPGFAPPEQYEKISAQGPWTDIYALGATLYYMLTGVKPEESTSRKIKDTLPSPHELNPEIEENLSNAVMKAMAIEKHLRFQTVEEFEKAISGKRKVATLAKEKKNRKKKRIVGMLSAAVFLLIVCGILGMAFWKQKEAETLPEANIAVYYELSGIAEQDTAKAKALDSVAKAFNDSFPDVSIELVGIESEGYFDAICASLGKPDSLGYSPAIFESSTLGDEQISAVAADLSPIITSDNLETCYSWSQYGMDFPLYNQLPFGFAAPVIFCNKTVAAFPGFAVSDFNELLNSIGESKGIAVNVKAQKSVGLAYGEDVFNNPNVTVVENADAFLAGEYAFYISFSDEYCMVQSGLPACYCIAAIDAEEVVAAFRDLYSMGTGLTKDEKKVALAFLNYMLSDNAQDICYIQNWTGVLPLNTYALSLIEDVYNDFSGFFYNITNYTFE